jgi:hypothetical protein
MHWRFTMATQKKKPALSGEAARLLEQYRNASNGIKPVGAATQGSGGGAAGKSSAPAGGASQMRRSGTRGK